VTRVGIEPTTYGLKEPGGTLTSADSRLNAGFDARGRSYALVSAVTMLVTVVSYGQAFGIAFARVDHTRSTMGGVLREKPIRLMVGGLLDLHGRTHRTMISWLLWVPRTLRGIARSRHCSGG